MSVVLDGVAKTVDYEMTQLCQAGAGGPRYFRLESSLPTASSAMDDASDENVQRLVADGETLLEQESDKLEQICAALTAVAADRDANTRALTRTP